jgi:hypothetical protein
MQQYNRAVQHSSAAAVQEQWLHLGGSAKVVLTIVKMPLQLPLAWEVHMTSPVTPAGQYTTAVQQ